MILEASLLLQMRRWGFSVGNPPLLKGYGLLYPFSKSFFFPPGYFIDSSNNCCSLVTIISKAILPMIRLKGAQCIKGLPSCNKGRHKTTCVYICRKKTFRMARSLWRAVEQDFSLSILYGWIFELWD